MSKYKKIIGTIFGIIGFCCLAISIVIFLQKKITDQKAEDAFDALRASAENYIEPVAELTTTPAPTEPSVTQDADPVEILPVAISNPYQDSFLANEDMVAWLQIPDTNIDYPVMWTPRDENYYLYRDFEQNENQNGCLILDTDSSLEPLTTNLIIHGHNMRSGAMFGNLTDYEDFAFFESHRKVSLCTETCMRNYEVIAVFRSQVFKKSDDVFKFYKFFRADTQDEFDDFYNNIKEMSIYDTGVTAQFGDHFLSLSTCVYHVEQGRFVVICKEVDNTDIYLPFRNSDN